ncbi:MAG: hypothetical protein AAF228_13695 [Pseudomonadota bacterium]
MGCSKNLDDIYVLTGLKNELGGQEIGTFNTRSEAEAALKEMQEQGQDK